MGKRTDKEGPIHRSIVNWLRLVLPDGCIVHHSANEGVRGGSKGAFDGSRRKAMGQVAGWPDITIVTFVGVFFIEVKAEGGRLTDAQKDLHSKLGHLGYGVAVARSIDDARECLNEWGVGYREVIKLKGAIR